MYSTQLVCVQYQKNIFPFVRLTKKIVCTGTNDALDPVNVEMDYLPEIEVEVLEYIPRTIGM